MEPARPKSRLGFDIAIICALTIEADAVEALFDQHWDDDSPDYEKAPGDPNAYSTGSIGRHNVVLAWMPDMGKVSSATVAVNCRASFPNIKLALVVGVCGVVPFVPQSNVEINLGDVILSRGIVQYDFGRRLPERFIRKDTIPEALGRPNGEIRSLLAKLEGIRGRKGLTSKIATYLSNLQKRPELGAEYPGAQYDKLFKAIYRHVSDGNTCEECGCSGGPVVRARFPQGIPQPAVHFGLIASGDAVMKSGVERDKIARQEGVIGFEMEGAGVWDTFPCVVIKGASDYADSHKTKVWQRYAAATAAACSKAVLEFWTPSKITQLDGSTELLTKYIIPYTKNPEFVGREAILTWLTDRLGYTREASSTTSQARVSLYGLGGTGKTQIALEYIFRLQQTHPKVSIFWVHASNVERFRQAFASIAQAYKIPGYADPELDLLLLVKKWLLEKIHGEWLMVIDNADDAELFFGQPSDPTISTTSTTDTTDQTTLAQYLPDCAHGAYLITTRNKQVGVKLTKSQGLIEVPRMNGDEAVQLLNSKLEDLQISSTELSALSSRLEHLPLALAQGAAYIQETTITVAKYLRLLGDSDKNMVYLLSKDFETIGRDSETPQAVARTWMLSFQQIERQHPLASELLSFMSLLDRQDIPEEFMLYYCEHEYEGGPVGDLELADALGLLKAFSFVTEENSGSFEMHRLVQLVTRKWLTSRGTISRFEGKAIKTVSHIFPFGGFETRDTCIKYLSHANTVLGGSEKSLDNEAKGAKAALLDCLAAFYLLEGQLSNAEKLGTIATNMQREIWGPDDPTTLTSMCHLAKIFKGQRRWEEAEKLELQVLETQKIKLGISHKDTLDCMSNLAVTLWDQGRWEEAGNLTLQVLQARQIKFGADHRDTLFSMTLLVRTYVEQKRWDEAEKLVRQVMETQKIKLGADHSDTLESRGGLTEILWQQGRYEEAKKLEMQTIEMLKIKLGPDHPDTLDCINNYASKLWQQGQYKEAEKLTIQVIETQKIKLDADHPNTFDSIKNFASVLEEQGRFKEAEELMVQLLNTQKTNLGADHLDTLASTNLLVEILRAQRRYEEAETLGLQILESLKIKFGADHPGTLDAMSHLATIFWEQERYEEAEKLEVQVIETRKLKLGADHQDVLDSMGSLSLTFWGQGRYKESEELKLQVIEAQKRVLGVDHPDTLDNMSNLASMFWKLGRWEEAEKLNMQVLEARKIKLGAKHPETLITMRNLALSWREQGRFEDALGLMSECVELQRQVLGPMHPDTVATISLVEQLKS